MNERINDGLKPRSGRSPIVTKALREFLKPVSGGGMQIGGAYARKPAVPLFELLASTECAECGPGPLQEGGSEASLARYFDIKAAIEKVPHA